MKRIFLYTFFLFCCSGKIFSQTFTPSSNETYTYSRVFLEPVTVNTVNGAQSIQNIQYTDGLGRAKQSISMNAVKPGQDIVVSYFYEEGGRQTKQYMPISKNSQNGSKQTVTAADINAWHGVANAYSEVEYDNSPLNRVVKKANPGNDWSMNSGHTQDFTYAFNAAGTVRKYTSTLNTSTFENSLGLSGHYAANTLYKNTVKDEDGNITEEYKNENGYTLMTRVKNGTINLDTYYVYNQYNQLVYIIPPLNSGDNPLVTTTKDRVLYQYKYDAYGRLTEKKLPGKGKEYYVYDREGRVIMSTDTKLKSQGKWSFVKYDKLGRVIYTGLCTGGERATEQSSADNAAAVFETRTASPGFTHSSLAVYYTKNVYPTAVTDVLSVNYYDEYPSGVTVTKPDAIYSQPTLSSSIVTSNHSTKSLPTASFVKNVENNLWNKTLFWYDTKERLIGSHKISHLYGYTKTEMKLDFPGNVTESKVYHKRVSTSTEVVVKQRYVYSAQNLLLQHYHQVDSRPEELLQELTYDDLGRVINKKTGNNLQSIDYTYNIRGWLTSINDPGNLGTDLFGFKINYNQRDGVETPNNDYPDHKVKPKYNGSIAETSWSSMAGNVERYGYVYDSSGRLLAGLYQVHGNPYQKSHSEVVTYDNRGNIKTLYRTADKPFNGTVKLIDNLNYTYNGNRAVNINDLSGNANGYEGGNGTIQYDDNGNMTAMPDKGISNISYNFLNLPSSITDNNSTAFLYSADGTKLKKTLTINHNGANVSIITEYLDGFQYSTPNTDLINNLLSSTGNPTVESAKTASEPEAFTTEERAIDPGSIAAMELVFFPTAEGFYDYRNNRYIYQYKDHLGNVRISYTRNTSTGTAQILDNNKYYAFGMNHLSSINVSRYDPLAVPYNYKYNGKELQENGMYDYGWRQYMPDIARWNGIDQLAEKYHSISPYAYVANNPISFIDPDGRLIDPIYGSDGKITGWEFTGSDINLVTGYFGSGGDFGNLTTQLENFGSDFGSGPISDFWFSFDSGLNFSANGGEMPAYTDKGLTQWARDIFKDVKGADKIKVKTNSAPKNYTYKNGQIYNKDGDILWGTQVKKNIYISEDAYNKGLEWLYLVAGHEIMHYSFERLNIKNSTGSHEHFTIFDWEMQQLQKWGFDSGWMFDTVNEHLNKLHKKYPEGAEYGITLGVIWSKTGMKLINYWENDEKK